MKYSDRCFLHDSKVFDIFEFIKFLFFDWFRKSNKAGIGFNFIFLILKYFFVRGNIRHLKVVNGDIFAAFIDFFLNFFNRVFPIAKKFFRVLKFHHKRSSLAKHPNVNIFSSSGAKDTFIWLEDGYKGSEYFLVY
jgi:hypothetical protein